MARHGTVASLLLGNAQGNAEENETGLKPVGGDFKHGPASSTSTRARASRRFGASTGTSTTGTSTTGTGCWDGGSGITSKTALLCAQEPVLLDFGEPQRSQVVLANILEVLLGLNTKLAEGLLMLRQSQLRQQRH